MRIVILETCGYKVVLKYPSQAISTVHLELSAYNCSYCACILAGDTWAFGVRRLSRQIIKCNFGQTRLLSNMANKKQSDRQEGKFGGDAVDFLRVIWPAAL